MEPILIVRGCGVHEYDAHFIGSSRDFTFIAGDDIDDTSLTVDWQAIANCTVSAVVLAPTETINGTEYQNVVRARITILGPEDAQTQLTISGVSSGEIQPYLINIPIC